jgi:hypothetical protein
VEPVGVRRENCGERLPSGDGLGRNHREHLRRQRCVRLASMKMPQGVGDGMGVVVSRDEAVGREGQRRCMTVWQCGHDTPCFLNQSRHFAQAS